MKKVILSILVAITMVTGAGMLCMADETSDTTVPEQTEAVASDTQISENLESTLEDLLGAPAETTTEAPTETQAETTVADASSSVNTEAEYLFKTPFTVTILKDNTPVYSDASCTNWRMVMNGEKLTVVGSDGTFFKLESGEYIVNFALEFAEDASFEKAEVVSTEAPAEPSESESATSFNPDGIEMYEEPTETGGEVKAKEEKETDPRFSIFCVACGLGLALGATGGFFLGGWWNKRKMNAEHDEVYKSIKYGETKEALDKEKELAAKERQEEREIKKAEAKKKRDELIQSLKDKKANLSEKKAEQQRKKKMEKLQKMQAELGMAPAEDPDTVEVPEPEDNRVEEEIKIPVSTKKPFQQVHEINEDPDVKLPDTTYAEAEERVEEKPQEKIEEKKQAQDVVFEKPVRKRGIRPEDMEYGGKDKGGFDYYWDPNDPKDEPFRIKDGKKVFYPDENHDSFYDEDGNKVEY